MIDRRITRVYRGSPVTAEGQNRLIDGVNTLGQATFRTVQLAQQFGQFQFLVITNPTPAIGYVICEHSPSLGGGQQAQQIRVQLWPSLFITAGYTYTDNNTRTHTGTTTEQTMTPPIAAGDWLLCQHLTNPAGPSNYTGWYDVSPTGRMWAEVVPETPPP